MGLIRAALLLVAWAGAGAAEDRATIIADAFASWVAENGIGAATLAVIEDDALRGTVGIGVEPEAVRPLASLSKAVTAACIGALAREGRLGWDDTLDTLIGARLDLMPAGAETRRITVDELVTHTSGLWPDATQGAAGIASLATGVEQDAVAMRALSRPRSEAVWTYSNENYAVLGVIITEITGQSVETACAERVLSHAPEAGTWGPLGEGTAWGGWEMSTASYALFLADHVRTSGDAPRAVLAGDLAYGPGLFLREVEGGTNHWHFGGFCLFGIRDHGAFAAVLSNGWGVVATYDACLTNEQAIALNDVLGTAIYGPD